MLHKPTICFIADAFIADTQSAITGPMVQTYLLGKAFRQRGWKVHFIAYNKNGKCGEENYEDLTVHWLPYRSIFYLHYFFKIVSILRRLQPDYCYVRGRDPLAGFVAYYCRCHKAKFIWASAGETGVFRKKYRLSVSKKIFLKKMILYPYAILLDRISEYGIQNADTIIVQTATQQINLQSEFGRSGTILQSGHPVPALPQRSLPWKILWIGSIKPVKQPELFLELAKHLQKIDAECILAGPIPDAQYGEGILQTIKSLKNIRYMGVVPFQQSQEIIASCHILVNTTLKDYEGLPNAFVQAWLAGTVTVSLCTDPDHIIVTHKLGKLSGTIGQLITDVHELIAHPELYEELSRNAREYAIRHFSLENISQALENLLTQSDKKT